MANYPWDGSQDQQTHYSQSPDDATFIHLARTYATAHGTMHASKEFPQGITNGAAWYPLWGGFQVGFRVQGLGFRGSRWCPSGLRCKLVAAREPVHKASGCSWQSSCCCWLLWDCIHLVEARRAVPQSRGGHVAVLLCQVSALDLIPAAACPGACPPVPGPYSSSPRLRLVPCIRQA